MLCTGPSLRTAAIGCRMQPTLLTTSTYHTHATSTSSPRTSIIEPSSSKRRIPPPKRYVLFKPSSQTRSASSISSPPIPSATTTTNSNHSSTTDLLDWNNFFKLRKTRRWYQLGSSITTGIGGFVGGAQILTRSDMDALVGQLPLDPFISMGLITFACGGAGWLVGPILGTGVFNWQNRKFRVQMDAKEKEFYRRIKRYRVDPSASSMANPVPDYYGEKISSVSGYRQWLKDQRAFNKKRQTYV